MTKPASQSDIWAVVPAAGVGKRMQSAIPKQYLPLHEATVLEHTINKLLSVNSVKGLVIAIQDGDEYWPDISIDSNKPVLIASGGIERSDSVLNAMNKLATIEGFDETTAWALVHDAVRPCVRVSDIDDLVTEAGKTPSGGLLALPVRDTMKRQNAKQGVQETVDREGLWHALTPQLFPFQLLRQALVNAIDDNISVTDESSAMEYAGYCPLLVQGHEDNIKITRPDDLRLAELYFREATG